MDGVAFESPCSKFYVQWNDEIEEWFVVADNENRGSFCHEDDAIIFCKTLYKAHC